MATPITFLKEVRLELTKVTWPTQNQIIRLTATVLAISIGVGLFIGGLDFVFTKVMEVVIK